jgi:YD repeat-containing protein
MTEYRYNAANRLIGMTYPSGLVVAYGRDGQGRVNSVSLSRGSWSLPLVTQVSHQPFGPLSEMTFGYGQTLEKQWDANYEPDLIDSPAINYDYTLDDVGNLTQIQSTIEGEQRYEYDDLNRLETVREQNQTLIEQFAYDATGNRTSHTVGTSTTGYTYPPDSHRLQQVGTQARTFDAAGNTLTGVSGYIGRGLRGHYDHRNRLSHIGDLSEQFSARWEYNGRGERVYTRVSDLQAWTDDDDRYAYDESGQLIGSYRSVVEGKNFFRAEEIVWLDNTPVARVVVVPSQGAEEKGAAAGIEVHAIHTDHLNTPRALVNAQTQGGQARGHRGLALAAGEPGHERQQCLRSDGRRGGSGRQRDDAEVRSEVPGAAVRCLDGACITTTSGIMRRGLGGMWRVIRLGWGVGWGLMAMLARIQRARSTLWDWRLLIPPGWTPLVLQGALRRGATMRSTTF